MIGVEIIQFSLNAGISYSLEEREDWAHHKQLYTGLGAGFGLFKFGGA